MNRNLARRLFLSVTLATLLIGILPFGAFAQKAATAQKTPETFQINGSKWFSGNATTIHPVDSTQHTTGVTPAYTTVWTVNNHWAGWYEGDGGMTFNFVQGDWNIPCTTGASDNSHQLINWVGLGGVAGNQHLLQAGTWLVNGQWHIFFELFGSTLKWNRPNYSSDAYHCGDHMHVEVDYNYYSTGTNKNHVYIHDLSDSSKQAFDFTVPDSFVPDLKSADWIDERPPCTSASGHVGYSFLAQFQSITWFNDGANRIGYGPVNMGTFQNTNVTMLDAIGNILAQEDNGPSGTSFTDRWYMPGSDGIACVPTHL